MTLLELIHQLSTIHKANPRASVRYATRRYKKWYYLPVAKLSFDADKDEVVLWEVDLSPHSYQDRGPLPL